MMSHVPEQVKEKEVSTLFLGCAKQRLIPDWDQEVWNSLTELVVTMLGFSIGLTLLMKFVIIG